MKPPRGLSAEEAEAWARLAATVSPLPPAKGAARRTAPSTTPAASAPASPQARTAPEPPRPIRAAKSPPVRPETPLAAPASANHGLDSHWERKLRAGTLSPDFTLDLHGHRLDAAHGRLMGGLTQARAMGARIVLLIAGKSRPAAAADRGVQRGAIRAKVLDWLAASSHSAAIATIRKAHPRHGGEGALYIVLRKQR